MRDEHGGYVHCVIQQHHDGWAGIWRRARTGVTRAQEGLAQTWSPSVNQKLFQNSTRTTCSKRQTVILALWKKYNNDIYVYGNMYRQDFLPHKLFSSTALLCFPSLCMFVEELHSSSHESNGVCFWSWLDRFTNYNLINLCFNKTKLLKSSFN